MIRVIFIYLLFIAGCSNQISYDSRQTTSLDKKQTIYMLHGLEIASCSKKKPFYQFHCYEESFKTLSKNWVQLKETSEFKSEFLDEIVKINNSGVLKEYIFKHYYKTGWGIPDSINWSAYEIVASNLKMQHPLVYPYSKI
ncbi:hypothetical protein [Teredinibacter turnerae]|uniref:hypothetical protein n=1 Tax=Teredinibacter turnerae TaxID=2426 RepID=UPI00048B8EBA|nr:hypothetical protein [Teredinibacter turnerae]